MLAGRPVLFEAGQVLRSEPAVCGVLGPLDLGTVQVAVDLDGEIGLVPYSGAVVAGPGGGREQTPDPCQVPPRLFRDLAGEGRQEGFAGFDVTSDDVPAVGKRRRSGPRF